MQKNVNFKDNKSKIDENKIVALFHSPNFLSRFEKVKTKEEIIYIFNKNNVHITSEDLEVLHNICERYVDRGIEIIDDETFLENVAAGAHEIKAQNHSIAEKIVDILSNDENR